MECSGLDRVSTKGLGGAAVLHWRVWLAAGVLASLRGANASGFSAAGVKTTEVKSATCGPVTSSIPTIHETLLAGITMPGQRMISLTQDALLASRWATVVDCEHPEWPSRMVLLAGMTPAKLLEPSLKVQSRIAPPVLLMVRAGETIRVWSRDAVATLETSGVAEESGPAGKRIRVRLMRPGSKAQETEAQEPEIRVFGLIDGSGSVEMIR